MTNSLVKHETKIWEILSLVNFQGMSYQEAFKQVGISDETWRRWIQQHPEAIEEFRNMLVSTNRQMLFDAVQGQKAIVTALVSAVTDPTLPVAIVDKLAVGKWLEHLVDKLTAQVGVNAESDEQAADFLGQPQFRQIQSRFTPIINVKPKQDGSVDISLPIKEEIIDLDPKDYSQDSE